MVSERRPNGLQAGYSLVFLVVLIALLSVMAAASLPAIKKQIQREKEAELIFRGLQYAEAIRVFQQRFGRYPNRLEELIELEPRSIRQLWTDPMAADGRWAFILASGGGQNGDGANQQVDEQGRDLAQASAPSNSFSGGSSSNTSGGFQLGGGQQQSQPVGPILGVVSRQKGIATRTFMGKDLYQEWRFTANILPKPQVVPGTEIVKGADVTNLGKPFPRGLQPVGLAPQETDVSTGRAPEDLFEDEGDDG